MEIKRRIQQQITTLLVPNKVNVIFGSRRTGKTYLLDKLAKDSPFKILLLEGEDADTHVLLAERSVANYRRLLEGVELLMIDEAQAIPDIGKVLKLMVDQVSGLRIIATGSSAFDLANQAGEPLTGRAYFHTLYPVAQLELSPTQSLLEIRQQLPDRLVLGGYPELFSLESQDECEQYLKTLVSAFLLKDILAFDGIRNAAKIYDLLRLVAYQMGKEVSLEELGRQLQMSKNTVEKYLDLLTKVFVVFKVGGYSRNLRKEITKNSRWYFHDNGIRNALINDFRPLALRDDVGALWENYLISERLKKYAFTVGAAPDYYFWRTYDQQEIDWIEYQNGQLSAFEFKWTTQTAKIPKAFAESYPEASFEIIHRENYLPFVQ